MRIAVLALQGAFIEHEQMLSRLGVSSFEIRQKRDLQKSLDGERKKVYNMLVIGRISTGCIEESR